MPKDQGPILERIVQFYFLYISAARRKIQIINLAWRDDGGTC